MKRYKYDQLRKAQQEKLYYKMYKAGKNWIVMGLTVVGMGILFPSLAKADDQEETLNTEVVQEDPPSDQKQGMDNTENELRQLGPEEVIETDKQVQNSTSVVAEQANENTSEVLADNEQVVSTDLSADAQVETVSQETPQIEQSTPRSAFRSVDMRAAQEKSEVPNARTEQELKKYLESSNGLMAKNSLTTPILPNPTTSSATTEDTFDEDMLSRAPRPIKSEWRSLSHYAVYYPFVKKLQAAYQAKDFKEVMNNIALINAFKKRSRAEYKIGFKEADNYTADIALRDSERSAAVIISMDQDGHIITESRTRDNKPFYGYVTGSGTVYKLTDDKEYYQGSFSEQNGTASAKVEYQVGKNGAQDYNDYNGNIADKINNRPEAKLGQYDYVGTDYYYANAAHDLIKYNDNDPKKDKFAVTKMDDLANATPNDYTITLVVNHYRKANTTVEEAQTTITYKDDSGANVTPKTQVRVAGSVGSNVAIPAAPEVSGYTLKEIKFNGAVKHTGDKVTLDKSNTLEYVYKKVAEIATIDISYKAGTQELQPARPVILSGEVGSSVAIPVAPEISEYKLKEIKFNGVTKDADTQVTLDKTNKLEYIYDKNAVSAQVTISYRAGDKVLVPTKQVNLSGKVGDIVVIPAAPVIANYHFVGATIDGERIDPGMNTVLAATNELIYKYAEDAKLAHTTVMYKDTKGNVLNVSEPVSLTGNVGANVNLPAALTISGYTLDSIVFNQVPRRVGNTVSLAAENTLEYIYLKDPVVANITVSYRAGENVLTPTNEVKFSGNIDEEVRVPLAPDVRGYQFKKATFNGKEILPNASVTLAESNTLIYNYERLRIPAKVTFEYVNEAGQTVKPIGAATLIGKIGDTVKLGNAPLLLKHQLKEIRFNGTVKTVGDSVTLEPENTVIYVYMAKEEKPATVTVSYKDDQGNNVAPNTQVAVRGNVGAKVNVPQAPEVSGYHVVGITFNGQKVEATNQVTLSKQNELVYNYAADVKPAKITLSYKDDQGNAVTPNGQVTINGDTGAKLNLPEGPSVTGYTLKEVKFNGVTKAVGDEVSLAETNTVEYIYSKVVEAAQTTVSYKAGSQTLTPASPVSVTGNVGDKVNVPQAPEVSGYHVVGITFNGQKVEATNQVTLSKQNELVYNYAADVKPAKITLSYKDDQGNAVTPNGQVTINGDTGAKLNLPEGPSVTGYTLKEVKFNGVTKAVGDEVSLAETNTVEYIYSKVVEAAQTTVSYKAGSQTLTPASPVSVTGNVGDKVNVPQAPEVSGYHVVGITFNGQKVEATNQVTLSKQNELVYNYAADVKPAKITLSYKDDQGNAVTPNGQVTINGDTGAKLNLPEGPSVTGYTLKEVKFNGVTKAVGDEVSLAETNTVEYIYSKVVEAAQTTVSYKAGSQTLTPASPVSVTGNVGDKVNVPQAPEVSGYHVVGITFNGQKVEATNQVTLSKQNELVYNYAADVKPAKITLSYKDDQGNAVTPNGQVTINGDTGAKLNLPEGPSVTGYTLKEVKFNGVTKAVGDEVSLAETNTVEYIYSKVVEAAQTTVSYKAGSQTLTPASPVSVTGNVGDKVNVPQAPEVSGYHVVGITFNGQKVEATNQVTLSKQNELVYNYAADVKPAKITLSYKDDQGNAVTPNGQVTINGDTGAKLNLPEGPSVTGYTLKEVKFNGVTKAVGDEVSLAETNTVEYIYSKVVEAAQTTVSYKAGSQTLTPASPVSVTGNVGDKVNVPQAPEVSGYHVVGITFNGQKVEATNQVTLSKQNELVYNYAADVKPAKITLSYKDDQGNAVTPNGQVTIKGDTGAKLNLPEGPSVTGYTLKEVKFNGVTKAVGDEVSLAETNTVEYIYSKVVEAAQTTVSYKAGSQTLTPASPVNVTGNVGDKVNVPQAPEVSGYHIVGITFNGQNVTSGSEVTLTKQNELVYNYATDVKPAKITLSYKDDQGNAVTPNGQVTIKGDTGAKLNLPEGPSVTGYTLKEVKFNGVTKAVGDEVSLAETNTVEYIYSKVVEATQTTVSYKAGSQTLTPANPVNVIGNVGDKVNVPQAPEVSGYHVVGITFNGQKVEATNQVTLSKQNELVYNYAADVKPAKITLSYKDDQGNAVTPNGQVTINGDTGAKLNLPEGPSVTGHTLKEVKFNGVTKAVGDEVSLAETNTVEYIYSKVVEAAQTTVSYKAGSQTLTPASPVSVTGNVGDKVNVPQAPEVSGYHVVGITFNGQKVEATNQVTLSKQNELVYNYAADVKPAKITLSYKDDQGNAVTPNGQVTINGDTGAKLNLPEGPSVTGYTLKEVKFNGVTKAVGDEVSLAETNTVEYIYSKVVEAAQTTVSYKAGSQTLTPASPVSVTGNVGDKVNVPQAPEVSGYHVVGITFNGQKVEATNQVTLSKQNELVYNYAADVKPAKITLSYKDDQGNAVTPNGQVTINGDTGAKLNLPEGPSVTGYTLKEVKFNGVTKAVGAEVNLAETNTVEYIYSKVVEAAQTTVSYKAGTQTLTPASPVSVTGNVGDKVNVPQAPEVSGYHVVGITFNGQNVTSGSEVTLIKQNELVYNYETKLVDEHVLQLNIIDDTTQKVLENGVVLGKGLLNEPVAKDVVDKYNAKFEELRTKGYDVRSYDELPADYTADKTLTIHVTHGTKEVAGSDRTVNVLLEYVYGNGPKQGSFASEPYKEEHTFTSINVVDKVTGEIVETKWSLPTASPVIKTPKVEGYVADKATVKIPDITPDSKDVKLNVTYLTILPKENIKIEWGHALAAKDVIIVPEKLENLVINQTWKLVPDFKPTSLTDRLTSGIVTVTLSDGTKLDVEVEIEVAKLSESNEPKVDQVTISKDKQLDPKQVVNNLAELPDRTQLEWVKEPTALADGVLNVKYPDGSNDLVEVKVKKTAIADDATQTPKDINEAGIKSTLEIKTTDQTETEMPKTTELPQTSDKIDNTAGILGIVVATLGGLLGFGTTKHKKKS